MNPRTVRVFVSSTFRDMQAEREELVKRVFPRLRKLCETRGVTWGEVDLRWGVTDEQRAEGKVLPICLAEINNCRPYFIGLLGERYGWIPDELPASVLETEHWLATERGRSITELEILHGVLNNPDMAGHAFFYFRDPAYIDSLPIDQRALYTEGPADGEVRDHGIEEATRRGEERRRKLTALKERIRASGFPTRESYLTPRALGALVLDDFTQLIDRLFPEGTQLSDREREALEHEAFAAARTKVYIGREAYYDRLNAHAVADGPPLVVLGESGSGKSALLSNWLGRHRNRFPRDVVIPHFIGATPHSADWTVMVRRIMTELGHHFRIAGEIPDRAEPLRTAFAEWLETAAARGRVILVLDGLNQLEDRDQAQELAWLPVTIPPSIRLVVSTLPGPALEELNRRGWPQLRIEPLTVEEREKLVVSYLAGYRKTLEPQRVTRIASAAATANPLYLRALLEEIRLYGVYERLGEWIDHYLAAPTIADLYGKVLSRYEEDFEDNAAGLVGHAMSLLWAARRGLSQAELLDLLGDGEPLPSAQWSPLFLAAESLLLVRSGLIGFAHEYIRGAVEARYLLSSEAKASAHLRIADYFDHRDADPRRLEELPWQLARAHAWQRLHDLLRERQFAKALWRLDRYALRAYWAEVEHGSNYRMADAYAFTGTVATMGIDFDYLEMLGGLLFDAGGLDEASALSRNIAMMMPGGRPRASALVIQGMVKSVRGELDEAQALYDEAGRICRALGDEQGLATVLLNQGGIESQRGDSAAALARFREAERCYRALKDDHGIQSALGNRATILCEQGELASAEALLDEMERVCRTQGERDGLANALNTRAQIQLARNDPAAALSSLEKLEELRRDLGDKEGLALCLGNQGVALKRLGNLERAGHAQRESERLYRELGGREGLVRALINQANLLEKQGDSEGAVARLREARAACGASVALLPAVLGKLGRLLQARGDLEEAAVTFAESVRACRVGRDQRELVKALAAEGAILSGLDRPGEAVPRLVEAEQLAAEGAFEELRREIEPMRIQVMQQYAGSLHEAGQQALANGNLLGAREAIEQQVEVWRVLGNQGALEQCLGTLAVVRRLCGDAEAAGATLEEVERSCRASGNVPVLAETLVSRGMLLLDAGDLAAAAGLIGEAYRIAVDHGLDQLTERIALCVSALTPEYLGTKLSEVKQKVSDARAGGNPEELARALVEEAKLTFSLTGDALQAKERLQDAYRVAVQGGRYALAREIEAHLSGLSAATA